MSKQQFFLSYKERDRRSSKSLLHRVSLLLLAFVLFAATFYVTIQWLLSNKLLPL